MLWVLIWSASMRHFKWVPTTYVVPLWGTSEEYHKICFCGETVKMFALFGCKKLSHLELCCILKEETLFYGVVSKLWCYRVMSCNYVLSQEHLFFSVTASLSDDVYMFQSNVRQKKKLLGSQTPFSKKTDACGWLFIFTFIFLLGTFLDIWVCLAKQNGNRKYLKSIYLQV